jgi:ABC-2 type transport system permease protein
MGIFTGIFIALFAITWFVLAHNFMKLATTEKGEKKKEYKEKKAKVAGYGSALLRKEFKRFIGSPTYMLNCGIGCILTVIAAVALIIKKDTIVEFTKLLAGAEGVMVLIAVAAICIIASTNYITAPSVSLEGKNIWLLQSLPVDAKDVLMAKLELHLMLSGIPTLVLSFAIIAVIGPSLMGSVLIVLSALIFVFLSAVWGLFLGLKMPNLKWTSEVVPIKQSMPVFLAMFGGWAIVLAFGGVFYLLRDTLFEYPLLYLGFVDIISAALSVVLSCWIRKKGAKIFAEL